MMMKIEGKYQMKKRNCLRLSLLVVYSQKKKSRQAWCQILVCKHIWILMVWQNSKLYNIWRKFWVLCFIILNIIWPFFDIILIHSIYSNSIYININYIAYSEKFKSHNGLTIFEEGIKLLLVIPEVVGIIKKLVFSSRTYIEIFLRWSVEIT